MVIEPKYRNNIFINSHPVGCAVEVHNEIEYVKRRGRIPHGPKKTLVIGSSTGYGLASRIVAAFGCGSETVGVAFEKEGSEKRPGTAGWYNTIAFDKEAKAAGLRSSGINGDAFSSEVKRQAIDLVRSTPGKIDLLVYSLASPVRTDPASGELYKSVLKPVGRSYTARAVDISTAEIKEYTVEAATEEEIAATVKVMGGEDWRLWIDALKEAELLAPGVVTIAYSYIGPAMMRPVYRDGTIGKAKEHLERTARELTTFLAPIGGKGYVSVNKALVTRSSAVIPMVPLYISALFKVMKAKGVHENCIQQIYRLFSERLYTGGAVPVDAEGRIRIDDLELREDVQRETLELVQAVTSANFEKLTDAEGYRQDFLNIHGFGLPGVDYGADVEP